MFRTPAKEFITKEKNRFYFYENLKLLLSVTTKNPGVPTKNRREPGPPCYELVVVLNFLLCNSIPSQEINLLNYILGINTLSTT